MNKDKPMTRNLRNVYVLPVIVIALVAIFSRVVVQLALANMESDARVVNIAGRQRMLSQRISKTSLLMVYLPADQRSDRLTELTTALNEWQTAHTGLQTGSVDLKLPGNNSTEIRALFRGITPAYEAISDAAACLIALETRASSEGCIETEPSGYVDIILANEAVFLSGMNDITFQYDAESAAKIQSARLTQVASLVITLGVLMVMVVFIFYPASQESAKTQNALTTAKEDLEKRVQERTLEIQAANQRLQVANTEIQDYANAVSHDLRSPIASIRGFLNEIRLDMETLHNNTAIMSDQSVHEILDGSLEEALQAIEQANSRMDRLTRNILQIAREGERELQPDTVDVRTVIDSLVTTFTPQIKERAVTVTIQEMPPAYVDTSAVEQVFSNVLSNAIKYSTPERPGKIVIKGWTTGEGAVYAIEDNGCGIAQRDYDKVFQLFRRAGKAEIEGDGIGLYYVRRLLTRIGGAIWFESQVNQGSTFYVRLPTVTSNNGVH